MCNEILSHYLSATFPPTLSLGHRTAGEVCSFRQGRPPPPLPRRLRESLRICVTSEGLFYVPLEAAAFLILATTRDRTSFIRQRSCRSIATRRAREKERKEGCLVYRVSKSTRQFKRIISVAIRSVVTLVIFLEATENSRALILDS